MSYKIKMFISWVSGKSYLYDVFLKGKKVIDLGCGEGELISLDSSNITGVDINKGAIERLRSKGFNIIESEITSIPVEDNSFDVVVCSNLIEHLNPVEAYAMIKEAQRILRANGYFIVVTPTEKTVWNSFGHIKPYTIASIMKLFREKTYESFEPLRPMKKEFVFYYGTWAQNKVTFLVSTLFSNIFPSYAGSYLLILKKND